MRNLLTASVCLLFLNTVSLAQELSVGKPAPDFTATGMDGKNFNLSDVTGGGKNVVLVFDRANW